jgi:hypothetical protein
VELAESIRFPSDMVNASIALETAFIWNSSPNILTGINDKFYVHGLNVAGTEVDFVLTIPQGLYDLVALNTTIQRLLENSDAKQDPLPILSISGDDSTQRVVFLLNYDTTSIDFTGANAPLAILGMDSKVLGPYAGAPEHVYADREANFNTITSFLVHCDLTDQGLSLNGNYYQVVGEVPIDASPGSQIVFAPFNAARSSLQRLKGTSRGSVDVWLTNQNNQAINLAGEYYSIRLTIRYLIPLFVERN